jgi:2-polyprenyl-6-methoxyphenol hydroxylase-like FAD-dependent oxidoreductase
MDNVMIIGGGIGGLAAAIALRQRGIRAEVYEGAEQLRPVGVGILVPSNALQVLGRLGLDDAVQQAGVSPAAGEIRDERGQLLQRIEMRAIVQAYGHGAVAIQRARLHSALVAALDPSQIHLGKRLAALSQEADYVAVRFSDGSEARGRTLIGADGLRSAVRQQIIPNAALRYSGQGSFRAIAPLQLPAPLDATGWEVWGPGHRFGFSQIAEREVYWYATIDAAPGELERWAHPHQQICELFAAFPEPVGAILAATPAERIICTDMYDLRPLASWHAGRVALLGDAAHATTPNLGQGGAQAIEDGEALAAALAQHADHEAAFAAYEAARRAKALMVVSRSWQLGKIAHIRNPVARAARDLLIRWTPESVVRGQADALYRTGMGIGGA